MPSHRTGKPEPERALVSWKEIASFLDRAERTVKRWERERGLPVHRVPGGERGGVYAYPSELEEWLRGKKYDLEGDDPVSRDAGNGHHSDSFPNAGATPAEAGAGPSLDTRRRPATAARIVAWLTPLAVIAGFVFYLSGSHINSGAKVIADRGSSAVKAPQLAPDAIAVLPFTNVGADSHFDYLTDGITDSLIGNLAHISQLKVRSRDSVFRLRGKDMNVQLAGEELGVSTVVSGRVLVQDRDIEIDAEVTDVQSNDEVWGKRYTGRIADLLQLQSQLSGDIAKELRSSLSPLETEHIRQQGTQNAEAYDLYLKGRFAWYQRSPANLAASISYFDQAIMKDPTYALAYSGLADAYSVMPNFGGNPDEDLPKSNAAAHKALELDPTLAHPHAVLGAIEIEYAWKFAAGETEFKKALALDPNDATAHQWYAEKIGQLGRHQDALAEINRAHDLDPLSLVITRVKAGTLADAGRFDEAIEICNRMVQENPTSSMGHDCLYEAYWGKRMYRQAVEEWATKARLDGTPADLKLAQALESGFRSGGWNGALTAGASAMQASRNGGYASPFEIARLYAGTGDKESAFHWLDIALREHDSLLLGLEVLPGFEKIRSDPRFSALVRKVGLPDLQ